jgi:KaiC/GvpD/RAD55 family RecA-like ATPase
MTETFSFYRGGIWVTTPSAEIDVPKLLEKVKDGTYKTIVEKMRTLKTKDEQRELKRTSADFDYVTVGGTFITRGKEKIAQASGLMCHDIDNIKNAQELKEKLKANKFVHACFISPSGQGLKVIVKIPIDPQKYEGFFLAFAQSIGQDIRNIDRTTKDISRACFLSYDPEPYHNPESDVWKTYYEEPQWEEVSLTQDKTRSGYEFRECVKLLREGKIPKEIQQIAKTQQIKIDNVILWQKWNLEGAHYQDSTLKKAQAYVKANPVAVQKELEMTFPTISLPDAIRTHRPPEWLIKGLIPRQGICYVGGAPKSYKSTFAFHFALCCATGRPFLGHFPIEGGKRILYIQEENDFDMVEKFSLLCKGMMLNMDEITNLTNISLSCKNGITIDTFGGREDMAIARLKTKIEELNPDIIFFDSAVRMMEGDENKASDVRKVHNTLSKICKDRKILCFLLHHTPKRENELRGSGDFVAQADIVIMLTSKPTYNGLVYANIPYNRSSPGNFNKFSFRVFSVDGEGKKLTGTINIDDIDGIRIAEYDEDRQAIDKDEQAVWDWIIETNKRRDFSFANIKTNLSEWGFGEKTLQRMLRTLVDRQKLKHEGWGKAGMYKVPAAVDTDLVVEEEDCITDRNVLCP